MKNVLSSGSSQQRDPGLTLVSGEILEIHRPYQTDSVGATTEIINRTGGLVYIWEGLPPALDVTSNRVSPQGDSTTFNTWNGAGAWTVQERSDFRDAMIARGKPLADGATHEFAIAQTGWLWLAGADTVAGAVGVVDVPVR